MFCDNLILSGYLRLGLQYTGDCLCYPEVSLMLCPLLTILYGKFWENRTPKAQKATKFQAVMNLEDWFPYGPAMNGEPGTKNCLRICRTVNFQSLSFLHHTVNTLSYAQFESQLQISYDHI